MNSVLHEKMINFVIFLVYKKEQISRFSKKQRIISLGTCTKNCKFVCIGKINYNLETKKSNLL